MYIKSKTMKKLLLLFVFCSSFFCFSQNITINNTKRENIKGKIIVEGHDVEGITIFNGSSNIGVITNEKGELLTTANTVLVFIDMKTNKPTRPPKYIMDILNA